MLVVSLVVVVELPVWDDDVFEEVSVPVEEVSVRDVVALLVVELPV